MLDASAILVVRYLNLYRALLALALALLFLLPPMEALFNHARPLWLQWAVVGYLYGSLGLMIWHRRWLHYRICTQLHAGLALDLFGTTALLYGSGDLHGGLALLLILPLAGAGMAMRPQMALLHAAMATLMVLALTLLGLDQAQPSLAGLLPAGLHGMAYFGTVGLAIRLGHRLSESQALASRRGQALQAQQQLNAAILARLHNGTLVLDEQDRVQQMNEAAWYLLGMPQPLPRSLSELPAGIRARLRQWRDSGRHNPVPIRLAGGLPRIVPRFVALDHPAPGGVLIFLEDDSTINRRAEEISLRIMHTTARGMAHEIRNPLSAIHHAAQLLQESELSDEDRGLLTIIESQSQRIDGIIGKLLQITARPPANMEDVELPELVRQWARQQDIHIRLQPDTGLPPVRFDPTQLREILDELLSNTLLHGRQGGKPPRVRIRLLQRSDGTPVLHFCDDGPGIPPDQDQNIFAPFHSTLNEGEHYGLGLYLARLMAEANLARLQLLASDRGACFALSMLRSKKAYNAKPFPDDAQEPA